MKIWFKHILTTGMLVAGIAFTADSYLGMNSAYGNYEYDIETQPMLSLSLRNLADGKTPYLIDKAMGKDVSSEAELAMSETTEAPEDQQAIAEDSAASPEASETEAPADAQNPEDTQNTTEAAEANQENAEAAQTDPAVADAQTGEGEANTETPAEAVAAEGTDITTEEVPAEEQAPPEIEYVYTMTSVEDDYFDDALFIGDSRTVGLSEYCPELMERSDFYAKVSMTIYGTDDVPFVEVPVIPEDFDLEAAMAKAEEAAAAQAAEGEAQEAAAPAPDPYADLPKEKVTIEEALTRKQFGKIYMMLGINELGSGTPETFRDKYGEVIGRIRELQPDAIIYIQGIMHVTSKKSNSDKVFKNETINQRNEALRELADWEHIFYIDMNEATDDENGALSQDLSFDDVHLKAKSYALWYDYLKNHAFIKVPKEEVDTGIKAES